MQGHTKWVSSYINTVHRRSCAAWGFCQVWAIDFNRNSSAKQIYRKKVKCAEKVTYRDQHRLSLSWPNVKSASASSYLAQISLILHFLAYNLVKSQPLCRQLLYTSYISFLIVVSHRRLFYAFYISSALHKAVNMPLPNMEFFWGFNDWDTWKFFNKKIIQRHRYSFQNYGKFFGCMNPKFMLLENVSFAWQA